MCGGEHLLRCSCLTCFLIRFASFKTAEHSGSGHEKGASVSVCSFLSWACADRFTKHLAVRKAGTTCTLAVAWFEKLFSRARNEEDATAGQSSGKNKQSKEQHKHLVGGKLHREDVQHLNGRSQDVHSANSRLRGVTLG